MTLQETKIWILSGKFLINKKLAIGLWFGLSLIAVLLDFNEYHGISGNYKIFEYVYFHMKQQVNLYADYPAQYNDSNHYGPFFSVLIAPFALLPEYIGIVIWAMANALFLYWAVRKLPIHQYWQHAILILSAHEMMNASAWVQFNPSVIACILLGFVYVKEGKEKWALFFMLLATFVKIYGIVGFAFFFFSKNKITFIKWAFIWSIFFFFAPIVIAPLSFIIQSYQDWYDSIVFKAAKNIRLDINNDYQDISVMGMIRRIFNYPQLKDSIVLLPAIIIFGLQYLHIKYFKDIRFQLYLLCSVLLFTVIFSNGAESPTYIIAYPAVCLWFVMQRPSKWANAMMIFALLLTSLSYSDIFTPYVRDNIIRPYSLKALPCFVMWLIIVYQILTKQFLRIDFTNGFGNKKWAV